MSVHRGNVVRIDWPFSDRTGSKVRPAVVVQDDALNFRIADTVLVLISRTLRAPGSTDVEIDPVLEPLAGLRYRSAVSCTNFLTVDQCLIVQTLGQLSSGIMQTIDDCLKAALGLK